VAVASLPTTTDGEVTVRCHQTSSNQFTLDRQQLGGLVWAQQRRGAGRSRGCGGRLLIAVLIVAGDLVVGGIAATEGDTTWCLECLTPSLSHPRYTRPR
jgi:hypothetical protein